jgi:hypothetical protein
MGSVHHITAAGAATGWMEKSRSLAGKVMHTPPCPAPTDLTCRPINATPASGGAPPVQQTADPIPPARLARVRGRRA